MADRFKELSVQDLLARMATRDPVPGGGSAAALAGAMGSALLHMVVELTSGGDKAPDRDRELTEIGAEAAAWQSEFLRLAEADAAAYATVIEARRLPRSTERERTARTAQITGATREATMAPLETARRAAQLLELAERLAPMGNRNAVSDVGVGALLATAALRGAILNVRINLPFLAQDDPLREEAAAEVERLLHGLEAREAAVRAAVEERLA